MPNILFNDLPIEVFCDGTIRQNPVKLTVEDVFLLSEKEATDLADFILQLYKAGCESRAMKPTFGNPILKRRQ